MSILHERQEDNSNVREDTQFLALCTILSLPLADFECGRPLYLELVS